jgi:hypothetical protein
MAMSDKMVPLPALQESRNQNRSLKARIAAMEVERASVQAFLKQLGFSISAACASMFSPKS